MYPVVFLSYVMYVFFWFLSVSYKYHYCCSTAFPTHVNYVDLQLNTQKRILDQILINSDSQCHHHYDIIIGTFLVLHNTYYIRTSFYLSIFISFSRIIVPFPQKTCPSSQLYCQLFFFVPKHPVSTYVYVASLILSIVHTLNIKTFFKFVI